MNKTTKTKPFLAKGAIHHLEEILHKDMVLFEWGSGGSTPWFADRVKRVYSVEHQQPWLERVEDYIQEKNNVTIFYRPYSNYQMISRKKMKPDKHRSYINAIEETKELFDVIVVDGRHRVECAKKAIKFLKKGGYLIFDDFQRNRYEEAKALVNGWGKMIFRRLVFIQTAILQKAA